MIGRQRNGAMINIVVKWAESESESKGQQPEWVIAGPLGSTA
jgi:hypothetical protein